MHTARGPGGALVTLQSLLSSSLSLTIREEVSEWS